MDHNLREMGISDQGVPHQMRRVGEAFYGRAQAYDAALAQADDGALADGARPQRLRGGSRTAGCGDPACRLCAAMAHALDGQALTALAQGKVRFPEPAAARGRRGVMA